MNNLGEKTKKAFIWDYFGNFLNYFLNFSITLFLARLLTPDDYGNFAIVAALAAVSTLLIDTGLNSALIQKKDINESHFNTVFLFNLLSGSILFIVFYFLSSFIASYYNRPILSDLIKVYSLIFILSTFGIVRRTKLRKELNFKIINQVNIASNFLSGTIAIISAFCGFGIWSLVVQSLLYVLFTNILLYFKVNIESKFSFHLKFSELKYLWSFGFPMFIAYLINKLVLSLESLILGKIFSIELLGYFNRAQSFNNFVIVNTSSSINNVFFPVLSIIQEDNEKIKNSVFKILHLLCFLIFFLVGFLYVVVDDAIIILLTEKWSYVSDIIKILLIGGFSLPISSFLLNILNGKGYSKKSLKLEIIRKSIFILNFLTGFLFGFYYYLIGYSVVCILWLIININSVSGIIELKNIWFFKIISKYLFVSILISILLLYLKNGFLINHYMHFALSFICFTSLYIITNYLLKNEGLFIFISEFKLFLINLRAKLKLSK